MRARTLDCVVIGHHERDFRKVADRHGIARFYLIYFPGKPLARAQSPRRLPEYSIRERSVRTGT